LPVSVFLAARFLVKFAAIDLFFPFWFLAAGQIWRSFHREQCALTFSRFSWSILPLPTRLRFPARSQGPRSIFLSHSGYILLLGSSVPVSVVVSTLLPRPGLRAARDFPFPPVAVVQQASDSLPSREQARGQLSWLLFFVLPGCVPRISQHRQGLCYTAADLVAAVFFVVRRNAPEPGLTPCVLAVLHHLPSVIQFLISPPVLVFFGLLPVFLPVFCASSFPACASAVLTQGTFRFPFDWPCTGRLSRYEQE
jgi:hypothetical protein